MPMNDEFLIDISEFPEAGHTFALEGGSDSSSPLPPSMLAPDSINKWDPRLVLDLAIAVDSLDTILDRYTLTAEQYEALTRNMVFRRELAATMRDIRENGASFRMKAKIQAESYLPVIDDLIWDTDIAASTRLSAIQSVVRWGDLEPKDKKEKEQPAPPSINVQINF